MRKDLVLFCIVALGAALGLMALLFPYAALPADTLARARTPQPMERMHDVALGGAFGTVSVTDLVGYYVEHPPRPATADSAAQGGGRHFGGC